jgi:hypothetical protein
MNDGLLEQRIIFSDCVVTAVAEPLAKSAIPAVNPLIF